MVFVYNFLLNSYSAILIIILYFQAIKHENRHTLPFKFFKAELITAFVLLFVDTLGRLDGNPGTIAEPLNHIFNFLLYFLSPAIASFWLLYVGAFIYRRKPEFKKLWIFIGACLVINTVFLILTQFFNVYYYIDENNIYHRGDRYWISQFIEFVLIIPSVVLIIRYRKMLGRQQICRLVSMMAIPVAGLILQMLLYGLSYLLPMITVSLIVSYFNMQNQIIITDYLTQLNNRMKLELYLSDKITSASSGKTFSGIMLDVNDFKSFNDQYGHSVGDEILRAAAKILSECVGENEFIARFGGDEFFIVLDVADEAELVNRVYDINRHIISYNATSQKPYKIEFSMGYMVYDRAAGMSIEEFERRLDQLMYQDKQEYKESKKKYGQ